MAINNAQVQQLLDAMQHQPSNEQPFLDLIAILKDNGIPLAELKTFRGEQQLPDDRWMLWAANTDIAPQSFVAVTCPYTSRPGPGTPPAEPEHPPETPQSPEIPESPQTPEVPDVPERPGSPETPVAPEAPQTLEVPPEVPDSAPDVPNVPGYAPESYEAPTEPEQAGLDESAQ